MWCIKNLKLNLGLITLALILSSCTGGGGSSSGNGGGGNPPSQITSIKAITIDTTGIVPLVNSNPTSSVIYVHNNTNHTIKNITYIANDNKESGSSFLDLKSAALCSTIGGGDSCGLSFTTPPLSKYSSQGSTAVTAIYTDNGKSSKFSQIINYANVNAVSGEGVQIMAGGQVNGFGNELGYTTVYAYGTGSNQNFKVTKLTTSKGGSAIVNGNIVGSTIQSGFVQAIEVSGQISNSQTYGVSLDLQSTNENTGSGFTTQANLLVDSPTNEPHLLMGLIQVVDTYQGSSSGQYPINLVNTSNSNINGVQAAVGSASGAQIVQSSLTSCETIPANSVCIIDYTIPQYAGSDTVTVSGNATVGTSTVPVSATQPIIWFNSNAGALLGMTMSQNPLALIGADPNGAVATISINNLGGFNVEQLDVSSVNVVSGTAQVTLLTKGTDDTCTGKIIAPNGVCSYRVKVVDDQANSNGLIYLDIKGKYLVSPGQYQNYIRRAVLNYISTPNAPIVTVGAVGGALLSNMEINGDNKDSSIQQVQISNNGNAAAKMLGFSLNAKGNVTNLIIKDPNSCIDKLLAESSTCILSVVLGPQANVSNSDLVSTNIFNAAYYGGTIKNPVSATSNEFQARVNPNGQSLIIKGVTAQGNTSGTGTMNDPYIFNGYNNIGNQSVVVTYQNKGSHKIQITGFNYEINPAQWSVADTCLNTVLDSDSTCTLTFNNNLAQGILALNVGSSYNMNINLPAVVFKDVELTSTFYATPQYNNAADIKITSKQATVINSVTVHNGIVTVSHNLANAKNYGSDSIQINSSMESYFTAYAASSGECRVTSGVGQTVTQSCGFRAIDTQGNESLSVAYTLDGNLSNNQTLHTIFVSNLSGSTFDMTPRYSSTQLPRKSFTFFKAYYPSGCTVNNTGEGITGTCECIQDPNTKKIWTAVGPNNTPTNGSWYDWTGESITAYNNSLHCGLKGGWSLPSAPNAVSNYMGPTNPGGDWGDIAKAANMDGKEYYDVSNWMNNNGFNISSDEEVILFYWSSNNAGSGGWCAHLTIGYMGIEDKIYAGRVLLVHP